MWGSGPSLSKAKKTQVKCKAVYVETLWLTYLCLAGNVKELTRKDVGSRAGQNHGKLLSFCGLYMGTAISHYSSFHFLFHSFL